MSGSANAGGPIDGDAHVASADRQRLACVEADANCDIGVCGPAMRGQRPVAFGCSPNPFNRCFETGQE